MKSYESFALWAADQRPKHRKLIALLRKLVKKTAPRLTETVKWGNGCWVGLEYPVIFLFAGEEDHLQFGFFAGASLKDPGGKLIGNGKFIRHVKVREPADIQATQFAKWIREAVRIERS